MRNQVSKGSCIVTAYHPNNDQIYCEISVDWKHVYEPPVMYYGDGSGYPGSDEFTILKSKLITYCDEAVGVDEEIPDWVDWDQVKEEIVMNEL